MLILFNIYRVIEFPIEIISLELFAVMNEEYIVNTSIPGIFGMYNVVVALPLLSRRPILFTNIGLCCIENENIKSGLIGITRPFGKGIPGTFPRERSVKYIPPGFIGSLTFIVTVFPG